MNPVSIGTATLFFGDCMDYMAGCADKTFGLAIVDPTYGRSEDGGTNRNHGVKQKNGTVLRCVDGGYAGKKWDNEPPPPEYFAELFRVSERQIIWGANYMPVALRGGRIVWDKMNDGADQSGAEIAYCSLNERVDIVRYMWRGMMQGEAIGSQFQQGNKALNEKRIHPTQKPVKLYEWLLASYAKPGWKILDTHHGSGSHAIAANSLGFELFACENDPDYFAESCLRIENAQRQECLFSHVDTCSRVEEQADMFAQGAA